MSFYFAIRYVDEHSTFDVQGYSRYLVVVGIALRVQAAVWSAACNQL